MDYVVGGGGVQMASVVGVGFFLYVPESGQAMASIVDGADDRCLLLLTGVKLRWLLFLEGVELRWLLLLAGVELRWLLL